MWPATLQSATSDLRAPRVDLPDSLEAKCKPPSTFWVGEVSLDTLFAAESCSERCFWADGPSTNARSYRTRKGQGIVCYKRESGVLYCHDKKRTEALKVNTKGLTPSTGSRNSGSGWKRQPMKLFRCGIPGNRSCNTHVNMVTVSVTARRQWR